MLHAALSTLIAVAIAAAGLLQAPAAKPPGDAATMTPDEIKADIERRHPSDYYVLAGKLFADGKTKDEAVFWFYAGQLRYRFHLAANPGLPKDGDPALFASLLQVVGMPLNEYAFGDISQLIATVDKVLEWDERTDNTFTSKSEHAKAWKDTRDGLVKLREHVRTSADEIRATRKKNGLENRGA